VANGTISIKIYSIKALTTTSKPIFNDVIKEFTTRRNTKKFFMQISR
jgi:hypothetical protein